MAHHHVQQSSQQQWDDAIDNIIELISKQDNVQTVEQAIQTLIATGGQYASPAVHAMYLQRVPKSHFTRKQVSTFIAEYDSTELTTTYFKLVHFGGLSIDDSLRLFFVDLKLEALNNKNLCNVLLTGLAEAYKQNGGNFMGDIEDAVRIYNAMIMLQDSLHSKNHLGRSRMTEQAFMQIINDRKANQIQNFDESEMRRIYNSIAKCSLYDKTSKHTMQRSSGTAVQTVNENKSKSPKSYSKYGASTGTGNDIIPFKDDGKTRNINDNNDEPNAGSCCIIL